MKPSAHFLSSLAALGVYSLSAGGATVPEGLESALFSDKSITPSPACLCAAPTGEVFVGVDLNGSLGKGPGKGRIVRLIDKDNDGKADDHTVFAEIDNPRGLISVGNKLYVLHTVIPADTGILQAMHLSVLTDVNWDGKADGPPEILISNISTVKHNQDRGADHTTNGIRLGIDGWIYIAVGDFGFVNAEGRDGTKMTYLGGGVLRVRPDGKEMEMYTHHLRNIYDVAIDPFMNIFTRGNTNDGGGWNIRFIHHIQSADYGYPMKFKFFTPEVLPALADLGGGSGTGSLFFQEPGWPEAFNNVPMMCDWGRSQLIIHRVTPDGASFTQKPEDFIKLSQISDADVDGSGRLYLSAWDGAGYKGDPNKGFIDRVVPKGWTYKAFPDLAKLAPADLVALLRTDSATTRLHAQQEILRRPAETLWREVAAVSLDKTASLESRVAAIFTYKQMRGAEATDGLTKLAADPAVQEWALRAMADRKTQNSGVPIEPFVKALQDANPRVQVAAAVALGRIGKPEAAPALLAAASMPADTDFLSTEMTKEGPHATPNAAKALPHVIVQSLVSLKAIDASLAAVNGPRSDAALWSLRLMHDTKVVDGLIKSYAATADPQIRRGILSSLLQLHQIEAPYDGSWWWGTRPDTRGPYYKPIAWEGSTVIESFIKQEFAKASDEDKAFLAQWTTKSRAGIPDIAAPAVASTNPKDKPKGPEMAPVDLTKIAQGQGEIGKTSIEDVILSLTKLKGDPKVGEQLFTKQGCIACHTTKKDQAPKGPFMGHVGSILTRDQIAESILKPNASISQGFATVLVTTKAGAPMMGFITAETAEGIELRDIAGQVHKIAANNIKDRKEMETSMMPEGLTNALSLQDFASLVSFLASLKE